MSHDEHKRVVEFAIKEVDGRIPVVAGTGSNSTSEAIDLTRHAKEAGADGALMILPYYNKPTQEGIYRHFKAVAEAVNIPIIMYNMPGRTGVNMLPATVARLAEIENITAVKEASADLAQMIEIVELCGEDGVPLPGFSREKAVPLRQDSLRSEVQFGDGKSVGQLRGQKVRLRIHLENAGVFGIAFGC